MKHHLKDAFPPMPEQFHEDLLRTLEEVTHMNPGKRIPTLAIAALVAMLLLSGIALAAKNSELIARLFYERKPSKQAEALLAESHASIAREGIVAAIDEYLHDGRTLTVSWSIENKSGVPVMLDGNIQLRARIGDTWLSSYSGSGDLNMFTLVLGGRIDGTDIPSRQFATDTFEIPAQLADQRITVELIHARAFAVQCELVSAQENQLLEDDWENGVYTRDDVIVCDALGRTEPYLYRGVPELVEAAWKAAGEPDYDEWAGAPYDEYSAMAELGLISPLAELTLSDTLAPSVRSSAPRIIGDTVFQQEGVTIRVEEAAFSAASTRLTMTFTPDPGKPLPDAFRTFDCLLLDERGELLGGELLGGGGYIDQDATDEEGNPCVRYVYRGDPLAEPVEAVTIAPLHFGSEEYQGGDSEEAYIEYLLKHISLGNAITLRFETEAP